MKNFLASIFLFSILLTNVSQGQALLILLFGDKLSTEKFQMGINASLSYSNVNAPGDSKYRVDWAFGAFGEVNINNQWFLHFDLTVKTPAGAKEVTSFTDPIDEVDELFESYTISRELNYITLPVFVKYKIGKFKLGAGAQLGYLTGATDVYSGKTVYQDDYTMNRKVLDYFNRWDAGITAIIDYYFNLDKQMRAMRLGVKYYYGLTDILKDNPGDPINNSIFLLSLGIPVGGSGDE